MTTYVYNCHPIMHELHSKHSSVSKWHTQWTVSSDTDRVDWWSGRTSSRATQSWRLRDVPVVCRRHVPHPAWVARCQASWHTPPTDLVTARNSLATSVSTSMSASMSTPERLRLQFMLLTMSGVIFIYYSFQLALYYTTSSIY